MVSEIRCGRRTAIKTLVSTGLATSQLVGSVSSKESSKFITENAAKTIAQRRIFFYSQVREDHRHWSGAVPGEPTLYYEQDSNNKYRPAVYVFPVERHSFFTSKIVGHITISANRQRPPVIEYGNSNPPSSNLKQAKQKIKEVGASSTGRLLYQGGLRFGIQTSDDEMVDLKGQRRIPIRNSSEPLAVQSTDIDVKSEWDRLTSRSSIPEAEYRSYSGVSLDFDDYAWDGHYGEGDPVGDIGDGNLDYPASRGMEPDSWDSWDGCNPIAGTQIIMYHEGWPNNDENVEKREEICDALHHLMDTDDEGWSKTQNVDDGIDEISDELGFLDNSYNGENEHNISKKLVRSQIDSGRPFMLTNYKLPDIPNPFGKPEIQTKDRPRTNKKKGNNYNGHAIVGAGYHEGSTMEIDVYDGWENYRQTLTYGAWDLTAMITKIIP
ncbi:hypothetical protein [Natrinema salaciae]|uniref:Peptidase C39-like domain-containing protein n=1 Tax=Natrinema salaciae TaxID=1186196 RepID=A0A1H9M0I0_9EURY|nr:hypothetical protein [Natrinema salaciae]SER17178.1 hypothetical protein SAMN04489841_3158 [Natrinema salaciae]